MCVCVCVCARAQEKGKGFRYVPTVGLGVVLIFKISGRGIMDPDAPSPLDTLTLMPSSRYLIPTLQGFLQVTIKIHFGTLEV